MGARSSLIRQLLTESLVLSGFGAVLGLTFASLITDYLADAATIGIPFLRSVKVDGTALAFTMLVAVITGLLFGVVPGLRISGSNLQDALKDSSRVHE